MGKYTYLFVAEDGSGCPHLFQAADASCVTTGDLVEWKGELFSVTETVFIDVDGDAYRAFDTLLDIKQAEKIYSPVWEKNMEEKDGN